jgi:regulator of cell morphogenesis and NO signaling
MTEDRSPTLGEIVAANPAAARTLDRLGLDYCCHGERTVAEACEGTDLDAAAVSAELDELPVAGDRTWTDLDAPGLAEHIVATHHRYLRDELPLLDLLSAKVLSVHGRNHPELVRVRALVAAVRTDLEPHLLKEERVLFPAIAAAAAGPSVHLSDSVEHPIRVMLAEHDRVGDLLAGLRAATGGYAVPDDACASYRSLYRRLEALEADTHLHVHKENHTLFPAALALVA